VAPPCGHIRGDGIVTNTLRSETRPSRDNQSANGAQIAAGTVRCPAPQRRSIPGSPTQMSFDTNGRC